MGWNRETIVRRIYAAVDSLGRIDDQHLRQWTDILRKSAPEEVFYGLYSIFTNESRPRTKYLDQEYAGTLLLAVHPPCCIEPREAIRRVLCNYDFSIEQLPIYFEEVLGHESLPQILKELRNQPLTEYEQHSLRTFLFWLKKA